MSSSFRRTKTQSSKVSVKDKINPESTPGNVETFKLNAAENLSYRRRGTKPWTGGLTLTSSGHREMDSIFGGGQPLGTVVLLEVDRWTEDLGLILARYWAAEAVSQGQTLILAATKPDPSNVLTTSSLSSSSLDIKEQSLSCFGSSPSELLQFVRTLPRDLHLDKFRSKQKQKVTNEQFKPSIDSNSILEEVTEEIDDEQEESAATVEHNDEGLHIAWQYSSKVQQERSGFKKLQTQAEASRNPSSFLHEEVYCHSYDLNDSLLSQYGSDWVSKLLYNCNHAENSGQDFQPVDIADFSYGSKEYEANKRLSGLHLFRKIIKRIYLHLKRNDKTVVRLLIMNAPSKSLSIALPLLVSCIRENSLPVVIFVTIQPWLHQTSELLVSKSSLQSSSDAVLHIQGFSFSQKKPSSEFRDLTGLLAISKMSLLSFMNYTDHKRPPTNRYGLKRDRRKLQIQMLHLPPEEFSSGGGSVSGGGARSGGDMNRIKNATKDASAIYNKSQSAHTGCGSSPDHVTSSSLDF